MKSNLYKQPRMAEIHAHAGSGKSSFELHKGLHSYKKRPSEHTKGELFRLTMHGRKSDKPVSPRRLEEEFVAEGIGELLMNFRLTYKDDKGREHRTRMNAFGAHFSNEPARLVGHKTLTNGTALEAFKSGEQRPGNFFTGFAILPEEEAAAVINRAKKDPLFAREFGTEVLGTLMKAHGLSGEDVPVVRPHYEHWHDSGVGEMAILSGKPGELRQQTVKIPKKSPSSGSKSK